MDPIREPIYAPLDRIAFAMRRGDLLLFRRTPRNLPSYLICVAGRGHYSHAAMIDRLGSVPLVMEVREWCGGRTIPLERAVQAQPGLIDWYEADDERWPEFNRRAAVGRMAAFTGCRYGWWNLARAAMLHLPLLRMFARRETDDTCNGTHPPFCSQAVAIATRAGGVDPVPGLCDRLTEPQDLARSLFYRYACTLVP